MDCGVWVGVAEFVAVGALVVAVAVFVGAGSVVAVGATVIVAVGALVVAVAVVGVVVSTNDVAASSTSVTVRCAVAITPPAASSPTAVIA